MTKKVSIYSKKAKKSFFMQKGCAHNKTKKCGMCKKHGKSCRCKRCGGFMYGGSCGCSMKKMGGYKMMKNGGGCGCSMKKMGGKRKSRKMMGGNCQSCITYKGGYYGGVPPPLVGKPWSVDNTSGNYYANNKYPTDVQMNTMSLLEPRVVTELRWAALL